MEKRVLQAVLLSLAVLLLYQQFFAPKRAPQAGGQQIAATESAAVTGQPVAATGTSGAPASAASQAAVPTPELAASGARVVVESDQCRAEF